MTPPEYERFRWKQVAENRWERGIDEAEEFYHSIARLYAGSGRMFFAMTGYVSVSTLVNPDESVDEAGHKLEQALRSAWLKLRYDHPNLASWVEYSTEGKQFRKCYETFPRNGYDQEQQAWLERTFRTVSISMTGLEWSNSDPPAPNIPTLFVLAQDTRGEKERNVSRDIVFRSPHEIIDGIGTLQMLNNLLRYASLAYDQPDAFSDLSFGDEYVNLSPPFRVAAEIPPTPTEEQQALLERNVAANQKMRTDVEVAVLPFRKGLEVPGVHKRVVVSLSTEDTARLIKVCKELGVTVTHAFHAAAAMVLRDLQPKKDKKRTVRYISYSLINHRRDCVEPLNGPKHPASVIHSVSGRSLAVDMEVPAATDSALDQHNEQLKSQDFRKAVLHVKDFYHSIRDDKDHLVLAPLYWKQSVPALPEATLTSSKLPPIPPPDTAPSVSISSMGRVEDILSPVHGSLKADDPWVTGEELRSGLGLFLGTWNQQLSLSAAYNDAWHDEREVMTFLEACERYVMEGLQIGKNV